VIGVRFKSNGKLYYFDPLDQEIAVGDGVIAETARGLEYGRCVLGNTEIEEAALPQPLRPIIRVANSADRNILIRNQKRTQEAALVCRQRIAARKLAMNLVSVECTFDMNKLMFYFTAENRIDFRELVKDLAGIFRTRIELRQIGVRDEAKMVGGLGVCGRELCCCSYMEEFHPVSINMAKEQNLSLNPVKISGTCGRLMCCLKYEQDAYVELQKSAPKVGSIVDTPDGRGKVVSTQLLHGTCKVQLEGSADHCLSQFPCSECVRATGKKAKSRASAEAASPETDKAASESRKSTKQRSGGRRNKGNS